MSVRGTDDRQLEDALRETARTYPYPPARDLLPLVRARLAERQAPLWPLGRIATLAPSLATLVILALGALAFQPVAVDAVEALGLRGIAIFRVPAAPSLRPALPREPAGAGVATVAEAERLAGFAVAVPARLGAPDVVYVWRADRQTRVSLAYATAAGIPRSPLSGLSVLITQVRGELDRSLVGKAVGPVTAVEELTIEGSPAIWIEGQPHEVFYRSPSGDVIVETLRLAGNVLLWERDELLVRIEAQVDLDTAVEIARSMR